MRGALVLALVLAGAPVARAQAPAAQLATSPRRQRPPIDPHTRELRQARGLLAGGILFTALCGVGFGLVTWVVVDRGARLSGRSGDRVFAGGGAMFACTVASIAGIGIGAHKLRALQGRRVAWTGGLGLRF